MDNSRETVEALEQEADRLEQTLLGLHMPVRVTGGEVADGTVRYHLAPLPGRPARRLRDAADQVARALGVPEVQVRGEASSLRIEVPHSSAGVRLVPLIRSLRGLRPLTAVVGLKETGHPVLLSLATRANWHVRVIGPRGGGKSELLRTLALSLAMTTRPTQLRMLAVDIGGREMAVLESLPHLGADVATNEAAGARLVCWLAAQVEHWLAGHARGPEWLLLLDNISWLTSSDLEATHAALQLLLGRGPEAGVHVFAGGAETPCVPFPRESTLTAEGLLQGRPPGRFRLSSGNDDLTVRAAWLPLVDIDQAVRWILAGWRAG